MSPASPGISSSSATICWAACCRRRIASRRWISASRATRGALAIAALAIGSARAELPTVALDFARLGYTQSHTIEGGRCRVTMTLDEARFLAHADELKRAGLLDEREVPNNLDAMPDALAMSFALQAAPGVTQALYERDPAADACTFTQYLTSATPDSLVTTVEVFSYTFDRAAFRTADWASLDAHRFTKTAPHFHFDHDFQKRLYGEFYRR